MITRQMTRFISSSLRALSVGIFHFCVSRTFTPGYGISSGIEKIATRIFLSYHVMLP